MTIVRTPSFTKKLLDSYKQSPREMLFLRMACNLAMRSCAMDHNPAPIPILGLFPAPLVLYHDWKGSARRFSLMSQMTKVGMKKEALISGIQGIDLFGRGVNNLSRSFTSVAQLLGFAQIATISLIFIVIVPRFLTFTCAMGVIGDSCNLVRVIKAYHELSKMEKNGNDDALIETLKFIRDGSKLSENIGDPLKGKKIQMINIELHKEKHFRNGSYAQIKGRIDALFNRLDVALLNTRELLRKTENSSLDESIRKKIKEFCQLDEKKSSMGTLWSYYDEIGNALKKNGEVLDAKLWGSLQENREELRKIMREGRGILEGSRSEMRRLLINQVIQVIFSTLMLAANSVSLTEQGKRGEELSNILSITALSLHIIRFLSDKFIPILPKKSDLG